MSEIILSPAYEALRDAARRRIEFDWQITGREQVVLRVILAGSYDLGKMRARVISQAQLVRICGFDKSDMSRLLRRLISLGALSVWKHCDETQYKIETGCQSVPLRKSCSPTSVAERERAMAEYLDLQERHLEGDDVDGQMRLPGVLPPEDVELEADALRVMLEPTDLEIDNIVNLPTEPDAVPLPPGVSREELDRQLSAFRSRLDDPPAPAQRHPDPGPTTAPAEAELERYRRGLSDEMAYLWDCLVIEIRRRRRNPRTGGDNWAEFVQYAGPWRKRLLDDPKALQEAVGDHKLRSTGRHGPADSPGAWIYTQYQTVTANKTAL
jgi:hypothetical protein